MDNNQESILHPCETLRSEMEGQGMSQKELAIRTGATEKHISTVLSGDRDISVAFARKLGYVFEHDAAYWIELQAKYDSYQLQLQDENEISNEELTVLKSMHDIVDYFTLRGFLRNHCGDVTRVIRLRSLLGVSSLLAIPQITYNAAYRAQLSNNAKIDPYVLFAWQRLCEKETEKIIPECSLNPAKLSDSLALIKQQMFGGISEGITSLRDIFSKCGIAFQVVKNFRGAPVQGFIKETQDKKVILCLTIRGSRADVFWFTLFHEIGHLLHGDVSTRFVDFDSVQGKAEIAADTFAGEQLIPAEAYRCFIHQSETIDWAGIEEFSKQIGVQPFIVLGRLQKDNILDWSDFPSKVLRYQWA